MNAATLELKTKFARVGVMLSAIVIVMGIVLAIISRHQHATVGITIMSTGVAVLSANIAALARLKWITPTA